MKCFKFGIVVNSLVLIKIRQYREKLCCKKNTSEMFLCKEVLLLAGEAKKLFAVKIV